MGYKAFIRKLAKFILASQPEKTVNVSVSQINYGEILSGRKIIITGGSRGLGYYMAKKCIKEGASVVISGRDEKALIKATEEFGEKCKYIVYDIANVKNATVFFDECEKQLGGEFDSLINNAGVSFHENHIKNVTIEGFEKQFNINLKGSYFLAQEFIKRKSENNSQNANLIFISSETADQCYDIPYGLTKASINSLVGALSRREYTSGIRINAVSPGVTLSDMTKGYAAAEDGNLYSKNRASERYFLPEEVAELICFLLSDASKCISGEIIHCNAGHHLKAFWD